MFWRFGGYANISTLNNILEKPDVTLEEVLEESDLIQELKQSNSKLIEFLREENVLRKLLEHVVAPPVPRPEDDAEGDESEEEQLRGTSLSPFRRREVKEKSKRQEEFEAWDKEDKARAKNAFTACEILSSETWSILESLVENKQLLRTFWEFVRRESPLDATIAGYFTKINETLLDKKTDEMIKFLQSLDGVVPAILNHIDCAAVMDLLLKIISMEKSEGGFGAVDWLQSQDLIPRLLSFLDKEHAPSTQTSAGDFIKAIVTISANASQNEQSCIGPNNLTRQLVSQTCIENLLSNMLRGGYPLTVGVGMVIEVIRKNNSDYDPDVGQGPDAAPTSSDPIYLGTLLRCFARRVPDFMALLLSPNRTVDDGDGQTIVKRPQLGAAFGNKIEPLGFDRFKTCELMAELLHCSNMGLLNERGSEAYITERDQERERLKAEGALKAIRQPASAVTEFSEDGTSLVNGTSLGGLDTGHEERRKLEVANSSVEDDGFEDVGNPTDLGDDIKDDFDEKPPFEIEPESAQLPPLAKPVKPRLDLDEEFVDEPLSSPRLEAIDDHKTDIPEHPQTDQSDTTLQAESPTSGLTSGVDSLAVNEDTSMEHEDSPPIGVTRSPEPIIEADNDLDTISAPPLPHRDRITDIIAQEPNSPRELSPHPDDKPAPLFAGRQEHPPPTLEITAPAVNESTDPDEHSALNTTQAEEGDTSRSLFATGNDQGFEPHFEYDVDGQPIVGDFLKMMFVEHSVVPTILDFFFRFPWNNFLHNVVYDVIQQVFNGPMDRGFNRSLAIDLFQTGRVTERIIEGQAQSDEAQRTNNMRLGYMGHLTLVAEEVVKFSDRHPPEILSNIVLDRVTSPQWSDYVENTLSETRERDNAILGGVRPDMSLGPRQAVLNAVNAAHGFGGGASTALANAGLNGNVDTMDLGSNGSGTSNGGFGLSSGSSLLSGFGSSSDEEDEEMEDMEDADGGTGQDSFLPSHTNLTMTPTPPTDPPPAPPPLKVPPSRARRQLAARLALHSQQRADSELRNPAGSNSTSAHSNAYSAHDLDDDDDEFGHDHLADPIAHDDDDDDDVEGITFGEPLRASPPVQPRDAHDVDIALLHDAQARGGEGEGDEDGIVDIDHLSKLKGSSLSPPSSHARHLDLDDFANSPAADADDSEDPDDVEMKVALG